MERRQSLFRVCVSSLFWAVSLGAQEERTHEIDRIAVEIKEYLDRSQSVDTTFTPAGLPRKGEVILGLHATDKQVRPQNLNPKPEPL